ncbi:hypothetical protein DIPPA_28685 [Diplonema papillatum]|nr:hypothetical protein DIPPA_28685 [Diplonema papillatum]
MPLTISRGTAGDAARRSDDTLAALSQTAPSPGVRTRSLQQESTRLSASSGVNAAAPSGTACLVPRGKTSTLVGDGRS